MKWRIVIPPGVQELIRSLPPQTKSYIREALEEIRHDPSSGKLLRDDLAGFYSFRALRFRIVYRLEHHTVTIFFVAIGRRGIIYEELARKKKK